MQRWNPSLNFPFILENRISKAGPGYSFAFKQLASSYQAPGTRLHRKLRKRLHKLGALSLYSTSKQEPESSWMILTVLSERSLASFSLQRMLRASAFSLQHIYDVHRLSNNLREPPRSMVQTLLKGILAFKVGVKPPKSRPLQIPLLSHQGFRGTIKTWLRQAVISRKDCLVPFHLPPCNVVATAHLSLGKVLGNLIRRWKNSAGILRQCAYADHFKNGIPKLKW